MIIDGKSKNGMFLWSSEVEFELGDFVIDPTSGIIYIVHPYNKLTVSGIRPSESKEDYTPYPGEMGSVEDYKKYVETGSGEDKYISSLAMYQILQETCSGLDQNGYLSDQGVSNILELRDLKFANGQIKVSRSLISGGWSQDNIPELSAATSPEFVILRQTSYLDGDIEIRVQEILDPGTGYHYCRWIDLGSLEVSNWVTCVETDGTLINKYNSIKQRYTDEMDKAIKLSSPENKFNFIDLKKFFYIRSTPATQDDWRTEGTAIGNSSTNRVAVTFDESNENGFKRVSGIARKISDTEYEYRSDYQVTATIGKRTGDIDTVLGSLTFNILDGEQDRSSHTYKFGDISIEKTWSSTGKTIDLALPSGYYFIDLYGRYYSPWINNE